MSARKYEETVTAAGKAFGVTPSSVSRHLGIPGHRERRFQPKVNIHSKAS